MPGADAVVFREMTEADLADGLRLSRASGWNQTLDDWRLLLSLGPGLFRVGVAEGRIVASGGAVRYGGALAWVCMILVEPACRGGGLGTRVFDEVLERVRTARAAGGLRAAGLDATPAGRGIYLQRGFVDGPALVRMAATEPRSAAPPRQSQPMRTCDLAAVLALDHDVFGAERGPLLQAALASAPALARVVRDGTRVLGYCFGRHGDRCDHVGPVVADDVATARDLVAACLAEPRGRSVIVDARVEPSWIAALEAIGFGAERPFTRMYLGDARPPGRPALEHAVRGPEFA